MGAEARNIRACKVSAGGGGCSGNPFACGVSPPASWCRRWRAALRNLMRFERKKKSRRAT